MITDDNPAAALARKGKGVPRHFTPEALDRARERLAKARAKRWPTKTTNEPQPPQSPTPATKL